MLRLSGNCYFPLSGWKWSRKDYPGLPVQERPAGGYDVRISAIMPFYPQLSVEGAYERWKGDHAGSFDRTGARGDDVVYGAGLRWSPVPLLQLAGDYRHGRSRRDEFRGALTLNLDFDRPLADQLDPGRAAAARGSLAGSRLGFVSRDYDMPLEYRAVLTARARILAIAGGILTIAVEDGFGKPLAGHTVGLSLDTAAFRLLDPQSGQPLESAALDGAGRFRVELDRAAAIVPETILIRIDCGPYGIAAVPAASSGDTSTVLYADGFVFTYLVYGMIHVTAVHNGQLAPEGTEVILTSSDAEINGYAPGSPVGPIYTTGNSTIQFDFVPLTFPLVSIQATIGGTAASRDLKLGVAAPVVLVVVPSVAGSPCPVVKPGVANDVALRPLLDDNELPPGVVFRVKGDSPDWLNPPDGDFFTDIYGKITIAGLVPRNSNGSAGLDYGFSTNAGEPLFTGTVSLEIAPNCI
jgi:hypothetical protein